MKLSTSAALAAYLAACVPAYATADEFLLTTRGVWALYYMEEDGFQLCLAQTSSQKGSVVNTLNVSLDSHGTYYVDIASNGWEPLSAHDSTSVFGVMESSWGGEFWILNHGRVRYLGAGQWSVFVNLGIARDASAFLDDLARFDHYTIVGEEKPIFSFSLSGTTGILAALDECGGRIAQTW
jgi:hypothetical protein